MIGFGDVGCATDGQRSRNTEWKREVYGHAKI